LKKEALPFLKFKAKIELIGINPFVFLPGKTLQKLFLQAGKDKGKIPIRMKIDGHEFQQTIIKYSGHWRLYLNGPMRNAAGKDLGDMATFEIHFDPTPRNIEAPKAFISALNKEPRAKRVYEQCSASLQLEINRYLSRLKTAKSLEKNIHRAINFLLGKERFIGRAQPLPGTNK